MKTFLTALALLCAAFVPEYYFFVPAFRHGIEHAVAWCEQAPVWIFGMTIAAVLIDTWLLQRPAKWRTK